MNDSTNSDPLIFHRHQQHSINLLSAASPPRRNIDLACLIVSPSDRRSSESTKSIFCTAVLLGRDLVATLRIGFLDAADFFFDILEARFIRSPRRTGHAVHASWILDLWRMVIQQQRALKSLSVIRPQYVTAGSTFI
jgi:hypothetical protein